MLVVAKGLYGLGGNIAVLADALYLGERLGVPVAADWVDSMYSVEGANVVDLLFDDAGTSPLPETLAGHRVFPPQWADEIDRTVPRVGVVDGWALSRATVEMAEEVGLDRLAEQYDVVVVSRDSKNWYSDVLAPYVQRLVPNEEVRSKVDELGITSDDIAVHFRHGNGERTVVPPRIGWFFQQVDAFLEASPSARVLVCTDTSVVVERFADRYGDERVVSSPKQYPELGTGGMHYAKTSEGRYRSAVEAAVDMWAMGQCGFLVGSRSFFTGVALKLAAPLPRERVRGWVPEYRSHKPLDGHRAVTPTSPLGERLSGADLRLDGLFVADDGGTSQLYYLYWPLAEFSEPADIDLARVTDALRDLRLY